jgi:hypothetical protein
MAVKKPNEFVVGINKRGQLVYNNHPVTPEGLSDIGSGVVKESFANGDFYKALGVSLLVKQHTGYNPFPDVASEFIRDGAKNLHPTSPGRQALTSSAIGVWYHNKQAEKDLRHYDKFLA